MIVLNRKFIQLGQAWFDSSQEQGRRVDAIEYIQSPVPIPGGTSPSEFHTLKVDLQKSEVEIRTAMHKNTLYEINRSLRELLRFEFYSKVDGPLLTEFCDFYDQFALQKKRAKIGREVLKQYADADLLCLSSVQTPDDKVLTWHAYICSQGRARLLQSASHYRASDSSERSLIGRANRYHHYSDLMQFKNQGFLTYDFGGWYSGNSDEEKLKINHFKEGFGGVASKEYNDFKAISLRGKIYFFLRNLKSRGT